MSGQFQKIETVMTVRYAETDQMGIVHHSNYPVWFEMGRTDLFKKIGFQYSKIEGKGILLPLTDMCCRFEKPAKYEDTIVIQTYISMLTHVRVGFYYEVYNRDTRTLLAAGETNHGWTDKQLTPIKIEKLFPDLFNELQKYYKVKRI